MKAGSGRASPRWCREAAAIGDFCHTHIDTANFNLDAMRFCDADAAIDDLYAVLPVVEPTPRTGKRLVALEALVAELGTCPEDVRDAVLTQIRREVQIYLPAASQRVIHA